MSPPTFRKWWRGWASRQDIEFRQPCPGEDCQDDLAGDGTNIGIIHANVDMKPIEARDNKEVIPTFHRRNERRFIQYTPEADENEKAVIRKARKTIRDLCICILKNQADFPSDGDIEEACSKLPRQAQAAFKQMSSDVTDPLLRIALADVFNILASKDPLTSMVPNRYVNSLRQLINHLNGSQPKNPEFFNSEMYRLRVYSPEIRDLIAASIAFSADGKCHPAVTDLISQIWFILQGLKHVPPEDPVPQAGSYNPAKYGVAFYFTPSGEKLRNIRTFDIDTEKDKPDNEATCRKFFKKPQTFGKGNSQLFLWFCPIHGHCLGFHIMPGAEGRKDPYASLVSYREKAPKRLYYDFACQLSEYCMNRESGFFLDTEFFHDVFHGFSHKCTVCFKSSRLVGFEKVDTEICEQFNSFIQFLKYGVRQMSQVHFVFHLQYFIHKWNMQKRLNTQKRLVVALASQE